MKLIHITVEDTSSDNKIHGATTTISKIELETSNVKNIMTIIYELENKVNRLIKNYESSCQTINSSHH